MEYKEISAICEQYYIKNWDLVDGLVNVDGDVDLRSIDLDELPFNFGKVSDNFYCGHNNLTSLKGAPNYVGGDFDCLRNNLTSLDDMPLYIKGYCDFSNNCLYDVIDMPYGFQIRGNPVYNIYKYITTKVYYRNLLVDISYFKDWKIQIGKDIYIDRFKAFLDEYGLNSDVDIYELIEAGYTIKNDKYGVS